MATSEGLLEVADLISELSKYPPDARVVSSKVKLDYSKTSATLSYSQREHKKMLALRDARQSASAA